MIYNAEVIYYTMCSFKYTLVHLTCYIFYIIDIVFSGFRQLISSVCFKPLYFCADNICIGVLLILTCAPLSQTMSFMTSSHRCTVHTNVCTVVTDNVIRL